MVSNKKKLYVPIFVIIEMSTRLKLIKGIRLELRNFIVLFIG